MLRKILISAFLVSAFAIAQAQQSASLNGKWKVHASIAGNDSDSECTFVQKDSDITGTCTSDHPGEMKFAGKVEGKKVSWTIHSEYNGSPLTMKYAGIVEDGKITGDINIEEFGVGGDFTATPEK